MDIKRIKCKENIVYIVLWSIVIVISIVHLSSEQTNRNNEWPKNKDFIRAIFSFLPFLILFSIHNYILIPKLLSRNKFWRYIGGLTVLLFSVGLLQYCEFQIFKPPLTHRNFLPHPYPPHRLIPRPLVHKILYDLVIVGVNIGIWSLTRQVIYSIERSRLIEANTRSRLEQLKAQINPHFYLNMLNSIHGLVDLNPLKAKDLIIEMSRLMQYMLYDSAKESILLSREIDFLKDYIKMVHDRYPKGKVQVATSFPDKGSISNIYVPPLLYLVFVENAFKHGVDYRYFTEISISLKVELNDIVFICANTISPYPNKKRNKGGIGLHNIRHRLDLIYGKSAHLSITHTEKEYIVNLSTPPYET